MKRWISLAICIVILICTTACGQDAAPELTADEIYASLQQEDRDCPEYQYDKYMANLWTENVTYNETFLPVRNEDGSIDPIQLMHPVDKVLIIRDALCKRTYTEGEDFTVENGCIVLTEDSNIRPLAWKTYFTTEDSGFPSVEEGRFLMFGEGSTFHTRQYAVSYIHTQTWQDADTMPQYKGDLLPGTLKKLQNKETLNVVLTGDSISCGGNNSASIGRTPNCPTWAELVETCWEKTYGAEVNFHNIAVGGSVSAHGVESYASAAEKNPDLLIIGFGMNDSSAKVSKETFIINIKGIIGGVRAANPDCEVILLSSMRSNPLEKYPRDHMLYAYRETMKELEVTGVAVVDVTTIHEGLLERKTYGDMTGNNVNHPNDFLGRVYAQAVAFSLTGEGFQSK